MTLTPGPPTSGPVTRKMLVFVGLPMMEWLMRPSPMNPGVGRGATAGSHTRNGPAFVVGRTLEKIQGGGTAPGVGTHPWASVKLTAPVASAAIDLTPNGPVKVDVAPGARPRLRSLLRRRADTPTAAGAAA